MEWERRIAVSDGAQLAGRLDHAYLKVASTTTVDGLRQAVEETLKHGFRSICVPPVLAGTVKKNYPTVRVAAVVAYPLGLESRAAKTYVIQEMINQGVDEVDVVYDLFALVNDNRRKIAAEAEALGELTVRAKVFHKAIIETPILTDEQICWAAGLLADTAVDCVKTSTGYGRDATSLDHVRLLRSVIGTRKAIKASGGIRTLYDAQAMIEAGANILGTSNSVAILKEAQALSSS